MGAAREGQSFVPIPWFGSTARISLRRKTQKGSCSEGNLSPSAGSVPEEGSPRSRELDFVGSPGLGEESTLPRLKRPKSTLSCSVTA